MPERRPGGRLTVLGLGVVIALALALAAPAWVAADTTPIAVGVNASITFSGSGFSPNESLSVWETGPDLNITPLNGVQTDGTGGFTIAISFPTAGNWQATAHSIATGKEVVGRYTVGAAAPVTAPVTSPVTGAPAASGAPTGTSVGIGVAVNFTGSGYNANEPVSIWETGPDSIVTPRPGEVSDGNGVFVASVSFPSAGQWQVTAHGVTSGKEVIGRYAVGTGTSATNATTGTTTTTVPAPITTVSGPATGFSTLPPVTLGSVVVFTGSGFNAGEPISLWDTAPDTSTVGLPGVSADGVGGFTASVTFPSAGNWQVTAHGRDSGHQIIGRYVVTSDASAATSSTTPSSGFTSPYAGVPVKATAGTVVTFTASGFTAGETVFNWSTAPDSTVAPLDAVQASSTGRVIVTTSFSSAGLWQVTLHGRDSLHEVIGKYQVTLAS